MIQRDSALGEQTASCLDVASSSTNASSPRLEGPSRSRNGDAVGGLTRREALVGATALAALGLVDLTGCSGEPIAPSATEGTSSAQTTGLRKRVAIIGAGAGGISTAYFLADTCNIHLFEARSKVGGHCDSVTIDLQGHPITADLGAQFFHPDTHRIYTALLEELGIFDRDAPDQDETLEAKGSLSIFPAGSKDSTFVSKRPLARPLWSIDFATYTQAARRLVERKSDWNITVEDWVEGLWVQGSFREKILYPWIAATIGTTISSAKKVSARSILETFALSFPSNFFRPATTFNSKLGLEGNLRRVLDRASGVEVHTNAAITSAKLGADGWYLQTANGPAGPFDAVVMAAPPRTMAPMVSEIPWGHEIQALCSAFQYFDARIVIHSDPIYMPARPDDWSVYNAQVGADTCEGSVWLGAIHDKLPNGAPVELFKSWAQHRAEEPREVLAERRFRHPLITPASIDASRGFASLQGRDGLFFAGQYTTGVDLQETAVFSGMQVAASLAPESAGLHTLRGRLSQQGHGSVSYAL